MRAVVQRCRGASVSVDGEAIASFTGPGLVVLVAATHTDDEQTAARMADKVWSLRVFDPGSLRAADLRLPPEGPRELSCSDLGLPLLVISQFSLYGRAQKGRRPTWEDAAPAAVAEPLIAAVVGHLRRLGAKVATGRFGADMAVTLTNDGPLTVIIDV